MSRATETRAATARPKKWQRASTLDAPTPKPGQHLRWIRAQVMGQDDTVNFSAREREGYTPVKKEEYPDFAASVNAAGLIANGGLILCKTDSEIAADRQYQMEQAAGDQLRSANNTLMREQDSRMPTLSNTSRSSTSQGGPRPAAADE